MMNFALKMMNYQEPASPPHHLPLKMKVKAYYYYYYYYCYYYCYCMSAQVRRSVYRGRARKSPSLEPCTSARNLSESTLEIKMW